MSDQKRGLVRRYDAAVIAGLLVTSGLAAILFWILAIDQPANTKAAKSIPAPLIEPLNAANLYANQPLQFSGMAQPGDKVLLLNQGQPIHETQADDAGTWQIFLEDGLTAGAYSLEVIAEDETGTRSQTAPVSIQIQAPATSAPSPTPTLSPTDTATSTPSITSTLPPTDIATSEPSVTLEIATQAPIMTDTPSPTSTHEPTATVIAQSPSLTNTVPPTHTLTPSPSITSEAMTNTPSPTHTLPPTWTVAPFNTATHTLPPTVTEMVHVPSATSTLPPTDTPTLTVSPSFTQEPRADLTATFTPFGGQHSHQPSLSTPTLTPFPEPTQIAMAVDAAPVIQMPFDGGRVAAGLVMVSGISATQTAIQIRDDQHGVLGITVSDADGRWSVAVPLTTDTTLWAELVDNPERQSDRISLTISPVLQPQTGAANDNQSGKIIATLIALLLSAAGAAMIYAGRLVYALKEVNDEA